MQPPDEVDFSQEGKKGKLGMASRSEEHRRPDCHGSILMPLPQALDHAFFFFSQSQFLQGLQRKWFLDPFSLEAL